MTLSLKKLSGNYISKLFASIFITYLLSNHSGSFVQAQDLVYSDVGAANEDQFGCQVTISGDGRVAAVGANGGDPNDLINAGYVRVYGKSGSNWIAYQQINGNAGDNFGYSLDLSDDGSILAVIAIGRGVRIYELSTVVEGPLYTVLDFIQYSAWQVVVSPDGSAIGVTSVLDSGEARIFEWNGEGFQQRGTEITGYGYLSGIDLNHDGSAVIIGDRYWNSDTGRTGVFEWKDTAGWVQMGNDITGVAAGDEFGYIGSVSITHDGLTVVVGAPLYDGNGVAKGLVRVHHYDANKSTWNKSGSDLVGDNHNDVFSIISLSSNGIYLVVGAYYGNYVKVFQRNGNNYEIIGYKIIGEGGYFGISVGISDDGSTIVVSDFVFDNTGKVYLYDTSMLTPRPSISPSYEKTIAPTLISSSKPSLTTLIPSKKPSSSPSDSRSMKPTIILSESPSVSPSNRPTPVLSGPPSSLPSDKPSTDPSITPSNSSSMKPTRTFSKSPSINPSNRPTPVLSGPPSSLPSDKPSTDPSVAPSKKATNYPSDKPFAYPSSIPFKTPSSSPSDIPSKVLSTFPSNGPSSYPSTMPSTYPTSFLSNAPSAYPSTAPSRKPSTYPSVRATGFPSGVPSKIKSIFPSNFLSTSPSITLSTSQPTLELSERPTVNLSHRPTSMLSTPSSKSPEVDPSISPSIVPTNLLSTSPSVTSSITPSSTSSLTPSTSPSVTPSVRPSVIPSTSPSATSSASPSLTPSNTPSSILTVTPSISLSINSSRYPTTTPSTTPSKFEHPSSTPSIDPTRAPSTTHPSFTPSRSPTKHTSDSPLVASGAAIFISVTGVSVTNVTSNSLTELADVTADFFKNGTDIIITEVDVIVKNANASATESGERFLQRDDYTIFLFEIGLLTSVTTQAYAVLVNYLTNNIMDFTDLMRASDPAFSQLIGIQVNSAPSSYPSLLPSSTPSGKPIIVAGNDVTSAPTEFVTASPTISHEPTISHVPTLNPTASPTRGPTSFPSKVRSDVPSQTPTLTPPVTSTVVVPYERMSNSTTHNLTTLEAILKEEDISLLEYLSSNDALVDEPFEVESVVSQLINEDEANLCVESTYLCYTISTNVTVIRYPVIYSSNRTELTILSLVLDFMEESDITIVPLESIPVEVESILSITFGGVAAYEMNETEVETFEETTFDFLFDDLGQSMPPVLVDEVTFLSQSLSQTTISEGTSSTENEEESNSATLTVNVLVNGEYLPPPEIYFDSVLVEVFDEEGKEDYLEDLTFSNNEYFNSLEILEVQVLDNVQEDRSSGSVFGMLGDEGGYSIIAAGCAIFLLIVGMLVREKHLRRKRTNLRNEALKMRHIEVHKLHANNFGDMIVDEKIEDPCYDIVHKESDVGNQFKSRDNRC